MMKLTITQVSKSLNLPLDTLHRWIRQGRIPFEKEGDVFRFDLQVIEKWSKIHNFIFTHPREAPVEPEPEAESPLTLITAMGRGGVMHDIPGGDVASVLEAAVAALPRLADDVRRRLLERLMQRERLMSTGVGKGIAIPHPRMPLASDFPQPVISTVFPVSPVDFQAVDNRPVFVLFLLLSPSSQIHLQLLSRLSYCVRDDRFVTFLKTRPDAPTLLQRVAEAEAVLDAGL